jgi:hypothetical protein
MGLGQKLITNFYPPRRLTLLDSVDSAFARDLRFMEGTNVRTPRHGSMANVVSPLRKDGRVDHIPNIYEGDPRCTFLSFCGLLCNIIYIYTYYHCISL